MCKLIAAVLTLNMPRRALGARTIMGTPQRHATHPEVAHTGPCWGWVGLGLTGFHCS